MSRMHYGVHPYLESAADALIKQSLKGVTSFAAKSDILTEWKDAERHRREVYVTSGTPDPALRKGMFHRVWNSRKQNLNSRDGISSALSNRYYNSPSTSLIAGSLAEHWQNASGFDRDTDDRRK